MLPWLPQSILSGSSTYSFLRYVPTTGVNDCKLTQGTQFVVTMEHYVARVNATHLEDRLTFKWLILIRIINPIIMYFFVSVCSA
jgi:hypothetical protein